MARYNIPTPLLKKTGNVLNAEAVAKMTGTKVGHHLCMNFCCYSYKLQGSSKEYEVFARGQSSSL